MQCRFTGGAGGCLPFYHLLVCLFSRHPLTQIRMHVVICKPKKPTLEWFLYIAHITFPLDPILSLYFQMWWIGKFSSHTQSSNSKVMLYFHCNCKDPLLSLRASFKRERTLCYLALGSGWPSKLARLHQTPKYNAVSTCFSSIHSQLLSCSLERRFFKEHCCHLLIWYSLHCWYFYALINTQQVKKLSWILF